MLMSMVFLAVLAARPTVVDARCTEADYRGIWQFNVYNIPCSGSSLPTQAPDNDFDVYLRNGIAVMPGGGVPNGSWRLSDTGRLIIDLSEKSFIELTSGTCGQTMAGIVNMADSNQQLGCFGATRTRGY